MKSASHSLMGDSWASADTESAAPWGTLQPESCDGPLARSFSEV